MLIYAHFFLHRCPTYNNLPKGCYEVKKAGQCCPTVQCENGVLLTSTNNLGTIGSGGLISVLHPPVPQAVPTLPSGGQPLPGTGGTGFMAPSLSTSKFMNGFELELPKTECWFIDIISIVFVEMFGDFLKTFPCN